MQIYIIRRSYGRTIVCVGYRRKGKVKKEGSNGGGRLAGENENGPTQPTNHAAFHVSVRWNFLTGSIFLGLNFFGLLILSLLFSFACIYTNVKFVTWHGVSFYLLFALCIKGSFQTPKYRENLKSLAVEH
jgi:hypothetical protein